MIDLDKQIKRCKFSILICYLTMIPISGIMALSSFKREDTFLTVIWLLNIVIWTFTSITGYKQYKAEARRYIIDKKVGEIVDDAYRNMVSSSKSDDSKE